jgi:predicted GNAT family N-acyltransferase
MTIKSPESYEEFEKYCDLRWRILRAPWNRPKHKVEDEMGDKSIKLIAVDENGKLIGTGRAKCNTREEAEIKSMTVEENYKGKGIGSSIISELERKVRESTAKTIVINSRESAVNFYKKHGYKVIEKSYNIYGDLPHFIMMKEI